MKQPLQGLNEIPDELRAPVRQFATRVGEILGDNAQGLTLYGAVAAGTFDPVVHRVQSVAVLGSIDLDQLRRLGAEGPKFGRNRIAAPLVMTAEYIAASRDAFPLELMEISQRHVTLFGEDYFSQLEFADADVRLQCERETKTLLIGMRQGVLAAAGNEKLITRLEDSLADAVFRVLRGMLWIKGRRQPEPAREVLAHIEELANRKLPGIRHAVDKTASRGWAEFQTLYDDIAALAGMVNGW